MAQKLSKLISTYPFRQNAAFGFTLIELMVTIAIGTILMVVAVPNFIQFQRNADLSDAVSNFSAAANAARANAMKQGLNTYLVPNDTSVGWSSGWYVFADANFDQSYSSGTETVVLRHDAINSSVTITVPTSSSLSGNNGYLLFNGSGYPRLKSGAFGGATIVLSNSVRSSSVIVDPAGRVRSCTTSSC